MEHETQTTPGLSKELVEHLSKSIETQINNMMVWRSRVSLSVFLGPYIVLGSFFVGLKGFHVEWNNDDHLKVAVCGLGVCFLLLGVMSSFVEHHVWKKCNKWREIIAQLYEKPDAVIKRADIMFKHRVVSTYFVTYLILLASFICTAVIVAHLNLIDPPKP